MTKKNLSKFKKCQKTQNYDQKKTTTINNKGHRAIKCALWPPINQKTKKKLSKIKTRQNTQNSDQKTTKNMTTKGQNPIKSTL